MFEIGSTLRDARVRRNISLQQAEEETKIRVKYIQAMENEDFDIMPAGTYVKGFLRTYAEYLDLDYQLMLDEFNDRFSSGEHKEHLIHPLQPSRMDSSGPHQSQANRGSQRNRSYILVAVLAIAIIAVLAYLGWGNASTNQPPSIATTGGETQTSTMPVTPAPSAALTQTQARTQTQPQVLQTITFTATSNRNWVGVYRSNTINNSSLIWGATLEPGENKVLTRAELESLDKVWIKTGSITGLQIMVNDKPQQLNGNSESTYMVTATGMSPS